MLPFTQVCGRECVKSAFLHIAVEPLLVNTPNCEGMRRMAARQALQKVSDPLTMSVFRGKGGGRGSVLPPQGDTHSPASPRMHIDDTFRLLFILRPFNMNMGMIARARSQAM